jgi:hypothetical protein
MVIRSGGTVGIIEDSGSVMTPVVIDINVNDMGSVVVDAVGKILTA